jgi:hypothetical protein
VTVLSGTTESTMAPAGLRKGVHIDVNELTRPVRVRNVHRCIPGWHVGCAPSQHKKIDALICWPVARGNTQKSGNAIVATSEVPRRAGAPRANFLRSRPCSDLTVGRVTPGRPTQNGNPNEPLSRKCRITALSRQWCQSRLAPLSSKCRMTALSRQWWSTLARCVSISAALRTVSTSQGPCPPGTS